MKRYRDILNLNEAVQKSWWKVVKRPAGMPKEHTLIQWGNRYFCFTAEPTSQEQGETNPNQTKAAIWKCDRNGRRTNPAEDPVWDSKQDGWSAEEAMDRWLDRYADPYEALEEERQKGDTGMKRYREFQQELIEAALKKAKFKSPMDRLKEPYVEPKVRFYGGFDPAPDDLVHHPERGSNLTVKMTMKRMPDQKKFLAWARRVLKDWTAGKMSLAEVEMIFTDLTWLRNIDHHNPLIQMMSKAFKKRVNNFHSVVFLDADPSSGSSVKELVPLNKKTISNITRYFEALVDFSEKDWLEIVEKFIEGKTPGFVDPRKPKSVAQQDREADYTFGPRDRWDWIGPKPLDPADGYPEESYDRW